MDGRRHPLFGLEVSSYASIAILYVAVSLKINILLSDYFDLTIQWLDSLGEFLTIHIRVVAYFYIFIILLFLYGYLFSYSEIIFVNGIKTLQITFYIPFPINKRLFSIRPICYVQTHGTKSESGFQ